MKTYARQIPPEYQENPLMIDECFPENLIVTGNRDYKDHTTAEYDHLMNYFDEMAGEWQNACFWYERIPGSWEYKKIKKSRPEIDGQPYSLRELLHDYGFSSPSGKPWTTKERHEWRELLEADGPLDDDGICFALELMTGRKWEDTTIRGCVQRDWQYVICPVDEWTREDLDRFEAEYFNTGSEWMIHDEDSEPEEAEDISGYCMYCYGWSPEQIRREIARETGNDPEDVILYEYTGYTQTAQYAIA